MSNNHLFSDDEVITSLACGEGHSLISTAEGEVYTFGRNNYRQCTEDVERDAVNLKEVTECHVPRKVTSLDHEYVIGVYGSANSSFAITDTGKVYRWGLVHTHASTEDKEVNASNTIDDEGDSKSDDDDRDFGTLQGRLVGMLDEDVSVPMDTAARQDQQNALSANSISNDTNDAVGTVDRQNRQISSIVTDSASQWMLAGESDLYYAELRGMGYTKEDDEDREQNRGKEYHGMLKLGVKRVSQATPQLIRSPLLQKMTIVSMAVGYSHFMLLSSCGRLFASGYNDRGQLGLGHRIGTAEVKEVHSLRDFFVSRVACGQQHTLCIATPRSEHVLNPFDDGGDVYAWGQGMLGQLGIGVRGTSKGRLTPTLIGDLKRYNYKRHLWVTEVTCGDNFSVAVTQSGVVYSWGHSEYNQHGQSTNASSDYTDPLHYFVPREITEISNVLAHNEKVVNVKCGAAFSVAITDKGNCLSWGWAACGVLGRGKGYLSSEPNVVYSLGKTAGEDRIVECFAVGTNHVIVSTRTERSTWAASKYSSLLESSVLESTADVELHMDFEYTKSNNSKAVLLAHKVVLAARSPYFQGLINQALKHQLVHEDERLKLDVTAPDIGTMKSLLTYMYTDRVTMASARVRHRHDLAILAQDLGVKNLDYLSDHVNGICTVRPASTFAADMLASVSSENHFNDVYFYSKAAEARDNYRSCIISAHKSILAQFIPYFNSLFNGGFLESTIGDSEGRDHRCDDDDNVKKTWINIDPFIEDGVSPSSFKKLVTVAYCGANDGDVEGDHEDKVQEYMELLIGASRFNFKTLADLYEKKLFACVKGSPESAANLMEFAESYNFPELEDKCRNCIRLTLRS